MRRWLTWERRAPESEVLVVTNMWPDEERPTYGVFVQRQVDDVARAGVASDVVYLRGYRSPLAYVWAAIWFACSSMSLRRRYRLVHAHAGETALAARCAVGTPMLVSYCGDDLLGDRRDDGSEPLRSRLRSALIRAHSQLCTATVTKSRQMHDALPRRMQRRNTVLPNGVDTHVFRPRGRAESRAELGWNTDERVVLFAATKPASANKRLWLAREACRHAEREIGAIRLQVADGVAPSLMPLLMNAADVLLLTSAVEGSPNVVKEALMCNLPVVATPAGDVASLLDGVEPSAVCAADPDELGRAVAECVRAGVRSNGRDVAAPLDAHAVAERLVAIYERLGVRRAAHGRPLTGSAA